jgi:hypothetical protein
LSGISPQAQVVFALARAPVALVERSSKNRQHGVAAKAERFRQKQRLPKRCLAFS